MNQERLQSFINLIQKLLACPSGEEWILLRQHEALVTPELVQVMERVAAQLANQGNLKEAKFLHNLAAQIYHMFVAQTTRTSGDEDRSQAYLDLIEALLVCPKGREDELLAANQVLLGPGLVRTMQQAAAQMDANGDQDTAIRLQTWATEINRLWLQQHDVRPMPKQDPEPKHAEYTPVATQATPPQSQAPQASPEPQPDVFIPAEGDEDFWAEPSKEAVEPGTHSWPVPEKERAETANPVPAQALIPNFSPSDLTVYERLNRRLETIAAALIKLSETLTPSSQSPANPLWYMEVLERAYTGGWVLTSAEIQKLIGVQPICPKGSESFQRGCWIFLKAGKLGTQTAWRVKKEDALTE
ncbi:MAG: hypothetical protein WCD18_11195 [Thermosynechococcaceae cyanobacterium]